MQEELIKKFLLAQPEERLRMAADDNNAEALKKHFGQAGYDEYRKLANKLDVNHLSVRAPKNLIFVPGVMGACYKARLKAESGGSMQERADT